MNIVMKYNHLVLMHLEQILSMKYTFTRDVDISEVWFHKEFEQPKYLSIIARFDYPFGDIHYTTPYNKARSFRYNKKALKSKIRAILIDCLC
jgi:hypothetical protein